MATQLRQREHPQWEPRGEIEANMAHRIVAVLMLVALLGMAQQPSHKQVKNQQEFDLYTAARAEQDPAKKLAAIDEWKAKFPDTELREDRNLFYLAAYLGLQSNALKPNATPASMAAGEKAAHTVIENLDLFFAGKVKPDYIKDADWKTARQQAAVKSHGTLAALAMTRKDYPAVEKETRAVLEILPGDSDSALMLSRAIIASGQEERYPEAIYQVARAAGEVPDAQKRTLETQLQKMYEGYHGDLQGLEQVKETAAKSPLPPDGWTIKSVTEISKAQIAEEEQFNKEHPEIVLWRVLRDKLTAAGAEAYFETDLKNIELPKLKGKVLGQTSPKELAVLMDYVSPANPPATADATIKLDGPWKGKIEPGTVITITGAIAESFAKDPYMMTVRADRKSIQVLDQQR
jgi:hypothetical protein